MKRIISVLAVAALMAALMVVSAMPAFAFANPDSSGDGQGQLRAGENCLDTIDKQRFENQNPSHGHGFEDNQAPTNCDHHYQGF